MKRVRTTSGEAYREIAPSLQRREQIVLDALKQWRGDPPTSYELTAHLQNQGLVFDLNGCRPRLSSLQDKQLVKTGAKRACRISGRKAYTWELSTPTPPRQEDVHQASMF